MKIAIIGKVNSGLTYEEWVCKFQTSVDVANVTRINITTGNGILNQYVRKYVKSHELKMTEYAPDFKTYGNEAKFRRNVALVDNSDLVVGFKTEGRSKKSRIFGQSIFCDKDARIIIC